MCGLSGFLARSNRGDSAILATEARTMALAMQARGPDDEGVWTDAAAGIALAHRRLSIVDLSPAGHQPMLSASGRYVLVTNGEIYNHQELRKELDVTGGIAWRGHSDTEVMLAAFEAWGIAAALKKFTGMFAFALWDRAEHCLTLARDRLGEKPLYYGWCGDTFLFGSELKALCAHPAWRGEIDHDALSTFMRYGYVPVPHTIYRGIRKLVPGSTLQIPASAATGSLPAPVAYWRSIDAANVEVTELDDVAATQQLDSLLKQAILGQMQADVPLGAFLSGGVDSSTVVALMQAQSSRQVRSFSIGFTESGYDEAPYAKAVAAHLGTDHTELYVSPQDALDVILRLPDIYDEPFADSSQIPTCLVASMARQHVTVALSGDAGDELFGGYNRYVWGRSIWNRMHSIPRGLRHVASRMLAGVSPTTWDGVAGILPGSLRQPMFGDKLHKLAAVLDAATPEELYQRLVFQQREPESIVLCSQPLSLWADDEAAACTRTDIAERMMCHDMVGYLTDDILAKVDRAAMATSLETRVPLLDHHLVEFAWRLPLHMKIRNGQGKWLLRQVLYQYVPRELIERPKQGFGIPLDAWLRGPLRDWAEALLEPSRLRSDGLLNVDAVRQKWQEHLAGRRNWQYWLWNVLMFQAWKARWA